MLERKTADIISMVAEAMPCSRSGRKMRTSLCVNPCCEASTIALNCNLKKQLQNLCHGKVRINRLARFNPSQSIPIRFFRAKNQVVIYYEFYQLLSSPLDLNGLTSFHYQRRDVSLEVHRQNSIEGQLQYLWRADNSMSAVHEQGSNL